jgi:hypothetical protein
LELETGFGTRVLADDGRGVVKRSMVALLALMANLFGTLGALAQDATPTPTPETIPAGTEEARLWGYIDGDKFKVRIGEETFELNTIGADAPETD